MQHGQKDSQLIIRIDIRSIYWLPGYQRDCVEIAAEFRPGNASQFGLKVRLSPDDAEHTRIVCDRALGQLYVDRQRSTLGYGEAECQRFIALLPVEADGTVRLRVFLDCSVLEVFASSGACLTSRIYPSRADSLGLDLFATDGSAWLESLDVWAIDSIGR